MVLNYFKGGAKLTKSTEGANQENTISSSYPYSAHSKDYNPVANLENNGFYTIYLVRHSEKEVSASMYVVRTPTYKSVKKDRKASVIF